MRCAASHGLRDRATAGAFPSTRSLLETRGTHELESLADGTTRVTWRGFVTPRGPLGLPVAKVLIAILLRPMQRRFLKSIATLFTDA